MADKKLDLSLHVGHRERLRQNFLDDKLANYELLELLLSYAIPRRDVRPLARMLYSKFGGIFPILSAPLDELCRIPGMGKNTAIFLKVIQKIFLVGYQMESTDVPIFHTPEQFNNYCKLLLGGKGVEEMHILYLDSDRRLLEDEMHSRGTIDYTTLYEREIIGRAITLGAKFIILVHNHPKAQTSFSKEDVQITVELKNKLDAIGVILHDHCVVSGGILYSMRDLMLLQ
ncbi:MAG: RadC family protein [Alphaproteobacteria bacterium]|nr:RadC family protein [Alphaproteobacteria bacterium]